MGRQCKDYSGLICGTWKVLERDFHPTSKSHETFWIAECQNCGNITSVRKTDLDKNPKSCNNCKGKIISQVLESKGFLLHPVNIGDKFGLLEVIKKPYTKNNKMYCSCYCKCGNKVEVRKDHLLGLDGHSRTISCGCSQRSSGELKIKDILETSGIVFKEQYTIPELSKYMKFDFAIFDKANNLSFLIEYNGEQHYSPVDKWGGEEKFIIQQERDARKIQFCKKNNIPLKIIPYWDYDKISLEYLFSESQNQK